MDNILFKLIELLISINDNTEHHVFFDYSGHVDGFTIRLFKGGWIADTHCTEYYNFYLDRDGWKDEAEEIYKHFLDILNKDHKLGFDEECGF